MLLAIDTATQVLSVALHDGAEVFFEQVWRTANNHTTELAPVVQSAIARSPVSLTAIAVAIGPGTYSGLRVGVSLAKGLALTLDLPLVGIGTLDILAAGTPPVPGALVAVATAGRSRIIAGAYHQRGKRWKSRHAAETTTWAQLLPSLDAPTLISGEVDADGRARIAEAQAGGAPITLASPPQRPRRASWLAEEAWARMREDTERLIIEAYDPVGVAPVYARTRDLPG